MNYLEVNLTECVWDMYPKNYKISLRDLKRPKCMQSHAVFVTKPVLDPLTQRAAKPLFWPRVVMKCILLQAQPRRMGSSAHAQKAQTPHSFAGEVSGISIINHSVPESLVSPCWWSACISFFHLRINLRPQLRVFPVALGGGGLTLTLSIFSCLTPTAQSVSCGPWGEAWLWLSLFFLAWLLAFVSAFSHFSD